MAEGMRMRRRSFRIPEIWFKYDKDFFSVGKIKPTLKTNQSVTLSDSWLSQGSKSAYFNGNSYLIYTSIFPNSPWEMSFDFYCPESQLDKRVVHSRNDAQLTINKVNSNWIYICLGETNYAYSYENKNFDWSVPHKVKFVNTVKRAEIWLDGVIVAGGNRTVLQNLSGFDFTVGGRSDGSAGARNLMIGYIDNIKLKYL